MMGVAQAGRRLMYVGKGRRGQPEQEGQHRNGRPQSAQHHPFMVDVHPPDVKRCQPARYTSRMGTIHTLTAVVVATMAIGSAHTVVFAHQVTHNGTVVELKTAKYAQPNGGSREVVELEVAVVDPKTKKPTNRIFTIGDKTRLLRAGKPVKVAEAAARKDEKVAVVVDHDKPGDDAIEVRFEVAR